jgi:hypothetical protein
VLSTGAVGRQCDGERLARIGHRARALSAVSEGREESQQLRAISRLEAFQKTLIPGPCGSLETGFK